MQIGGLGERCKPQPTNDLVHFSLKIWHPVATILIISSIVKRLLWRASLLAGGQILFRGAGPFLPPPTGAGAESSLSLSSSNEVMTWKYHSHHCLKLLELLVGHLLIKRSRPAREVVSLTPGQTPLRSNFVRLIHTYVSLLLSSIIQYWPKGGDGLQLGSCHGPGRK